MLRCRCSEVSQAEAHRETPFSDLPRIIEPRFLHKLRNPISGILFRRHMFMPAPVKEPCEVAAGLRPPSGKIHHVEGPTGL